MTFERITTDPAVMGGSVHPRTARPGGNGCGDGRRRLTTAEILDEYPYLEAEDIPAALRYAAEAVRERELPLRTAG